MASFADDVFQILNDLVTKHRFVPARAVAGTRFAALVRQEADDVFIYVFVSDGRPSGANLDVDVWVAPPDEPGDGLDSLYVGYKVRIGSEYDVNDAYFINCQARVIHFLSCVPAIVPLVRQELYEPVFRTKRWTIYHLQRRALTTLLSRAEEGDLTTIAVIDAAKRLATGKGSFSTLEDAIMPIAATLLEQRALHKDVFQFFDGNTKSLASTLATHLYIRSLGEISRLHFH